uniref:uncharacterized protein LOC120335473 n=1 Tax=Styela clava TaxID=7725 RepID=UPI001939CC98|nr:uncharacterized protein LOC120335473 [Styela clava]
MNVLINLVTENEPWTSLSTIILHGELQTEELRRSENELIKYLQNRELNKVIAKLQNSDVQGKSVLRNLKIAPSMQKLNPVLIEGILRVGGRLQNAPIEFDLKHPIILPSNHHITQLIVREYHKSSHHCGASHTWNLLRQKFWIINGAVVVKRNIRNCIFCKKRNASMGKQFMADLPKERVTPDQPPFTCVGVDNFGPLLVKQGRSSVKRWGLIITCATTRAVHLEIVHSMDVNSFINGLRRFIARRGKMSTIICDNGSNFTAGNKVLKKEIQIWNSSKMGEFCRQSDIIFKFNPPTASHFGGFYERLIRSARKI